MFSNRERIARYDVKAALNCIVGMTFEKKKALSHPYPTLKDKIDKCGFDGKQLSHVFRLNEFMDKYCKNLSYKECLYTDMGNFLIKTKKNRLFTLSEAKRNMDKLVEVMNDKKISF